MGDGHLRLINQRLKAHGKIALLLFLCSLIVYLSNWRTLSSGDTQPASLLPILVMTKRTLDFSEFVPYYHEHHISVYFFRRTDRGYVSTYPLATGFLALPIYAIPVLWCQAFSHPSTEEWVKFGFYMQKVSAAIITSLAIYIFYFLSLELGASEIVSVVLSLAFAFGTEAWSTASQALWMHAPGLLFVTASTLVAVRHVKVPQWRTAVLAGLCCGVTAAIRLNLVLFVVPLLGWMFWKERRYFFAALVAAGLPIGILLVYNLAYFGSFVGSYENRFDQPILVGLACVLFTPGRGLVIYFPLSLFALLGLITALQRKDANRSLYVALCVFVIGILLLTAKWNQWHGGLCFGPRLLTESEPILLLMTIPVCNDLHRVRGGLALKLLFVLLFAWSVGVQYLGAFRQSTWDADLLKAGNELPKRWWDWIDSPISRAVTAPGVQGSWSTFRSY